MLASLKARLRFSISKFLPLLHISVTLIVLPTPPPFGAVIDAELGILAVEPFISAAAVLAPLRTTNDWTPLPYLAVIAYLLAHKLIFIAENYFVKPHRLRAVFPWLRSHTGCKQSDSCNVYTMLKLNIKPTLKKKLHSSYYTKQPN